MTKVAVESRLGALATYAYPSAYDATKLGLGSLLRQRSISAANEDNFAGPIVPAVARPVESPGVPGQFPWVLNWSPSIDWVFLADAAAAAVTRRLQVFQFNRDTSAFTFLGFITLNFPPAAGNATIRGFRMTYDIYSAGTAAVNGTAVTGTGTAWSASRLAVGSRIGFGSTNPNNITTWYEISAIGADGVITLTGSAGTIADGPYCIEDLRAVVAVTNVTTTNGGLFVVKGLRIETFAPGGTSIGAATTTDNIRAVYWLADAAVVTNTVAFGMGVQTKDSWTQQYVWVADTLANPILFKYNVRAALTLVSGKDSTSALVFKSGAGGAVTGTTSQLNNGRLATTAHGPGSGLQCFYFTTTSRIYRTVDVGTIISGSTTWLADSAIEVPPGSGATFLVNSVLSSIEYANQIDKFVVMSSGAAGVRSYVTQYRPDASQWDRIFLSDLKFTPQSTADSTAPIVPTIDAAALSVWSEGGIAYLAMGGTTAISSFLFAIPLAADWEYASASNQRLVLPKMSTPNCDRFVRAMVVEAQVIGGKTGRNLGLSPEGFRVYYRTSGIDDNTGTWTLLDDSGDMSAVGGAAAVQLMVEFKCIGASCLPSRVFSTAVIYNDLSTDAHYQPSVGNSDRVNKRFAWRFATAFGSTVPALRVRLYDAVTGGLLVDDNTTAPTGTWQRSTDGGTTWGAYATTDKGNETTYIRYTPASLGDNIRVRALLSLA